MHRKSPFRVTGQRGGFGFIGSGQPVPPDLIAILVVLFMTYSFQFFQATAAIPALLRLTAAVYAGFVWQLVTYPFVGFGGGGLWFLLELLILFWFGRDVFWRLGRKRFWWQLGVSALSAALVAVVAQLLVALVGVPGLTSAPAFVIMQGQRMLLTIMIATFATVYGEATILLFFVLPIKARWFLWIEVLFAFMAFLTTKDLAGCLAISFAVWVTYATLTPGGPRQVLFRYRRQFDRLLVEARLRRLRRKRRFDVIDGDDDRKNDRDRWVH
jgi:hypothetical protein